MECTADMKSMTIEDLVTKFSLEVLTGTRLSSSYDNENRDTSSWIGIYRQL